MMLSPSQAVFFMYFYCMFKRRPATITDCINWMHVYDGFILLFTSLMPTVDQRIWNAPSAAIMLFCNINKTFVHVVVMCVSSHFLMEKCCFVLSACECPCVCFSLNLHIISFYIYNSFFLILQCECLGCLWIFFKNKIKLFFPALNHQRN